MCKETFHADGDYIQMILEYAILTFSSPPSGDLRHLRFYMIYAFLINSSIAKLLFLS